MLVEVAHPGSILGAFLGATEALPVAGALAEVAHQRRLLCFADYVGIDRIQQRQDGRVVPDLDAHERPSVRVPGVEVCVLDPQPRQNAARCVQQRSA